MIPIKSNKEIEILEEAGRLLAGIINEIKRSLKPGAVTRDIDKLAEELIRKKNARPAFKGYRGFPASACISINEEVVHGIPGKREIQEGDIVSIDIGIVYREYFSDTAFTFGVGSIDPRLQQLIEVTHDALHRGIDQAMAGGNVSDISFAIQNYVEARQLSIVRDFVGHGIGRSLHEEPEVPNFGLPHSGPVLKEGMVIAIEPMVNLGSWETMILEDGWTVVTRDGQPSAHFEHTVAITRNGPKILTQ